MSFESNRNSTINPNWFQIDSKSWCDIRVIQNQFETGDTMIECPHDAKLLSAVENQEVDKSTNGCQKKWNINNSRSFQTGAY